MNGISKLLSTDGFIAVNKTLIRELGLHEAIMIGEMCSEYNYWEKCDKLENDMFYSTRNNIEYNTGLSEHFQRKALKTLQEKEIITSKKMGLPAINYYKINFDKLLMLLNTSDASREQLDTKTMNLNNNKQTKIEEEKVLSKDNTTKPDFEFGKPKPQKQNLYSKCVSLIYVKTDNYELRQLLVNWLNMLLEKYRSRNKVLYANVFKSKLNMLDKYDDKDWKEIIEYNLQKGYEGFYPIPQYNNSGAMKRIERMEHVESMTDEDYKELEKLTEERRKNGLRTSF